MPRFHAVSWRRTVEPTLPRRSNEQMITSHIPSKPIEMYHGKQTLRIMHHGKQPSKIMLLDLYHFFGCKLQEAIIRDRSEKLPLDDNIHRV